MTHYLTRQFAVEAVQFLGFSGDSPQFNERPTWLSTALQGPVGARGSIWTIDTAPDKHALRVGCADGLRTLLAPESPWIVRDEHGDLYTYSNTQFLEQFTPKDPPA